MTALLLTTSCSDPKIKVYKDLTGDGVPDIILKDSTNREYILIGYPGGKNFKRGIEIEEDTTFNTDVTLTYYKDNRVSYIFNGEYFEKHTEKSNVEL